MPSIDFATLKNNVKIEHIAAQVLGITLTENKDVLRGKCPITKSDDPRSFVITPAKQVWYSFKAKKGGDVLALVAAVKECSVRDAAELIFKTTGVKAEKPAEKKEEKQSFDPERYIQGLKPDHEALAPFSLSVDTLKEWQGGYSSGGQNKGRLALPIVGTQGIAGFMGIGTDRSIIFPKDLDPRLYIFGAHKVTEDIVHLMSHPLDVLSFFENAGGNGLCFLTETISATQLHYLFLLLGEIKTELTV